MADVGQESRRVGKPDHDQPDSIILVRKGKDSQIRYEKGSTSREQGADHLVL